MLFGKKTKVYAPNISANVQADLNATANEFRKKGGEKGARALMAALKAKGYKNGGEKLLMKAGDMLDFAEMAAEKMSYGGSSSKKMKLGGQNGSSVYSGSKKRKK